MFTLQILDRGQTLLHPITGPELWIGSAPGLELQLQEEGVLPRHLRLTVAAAELRLSAAGPVLLNGNTVRSATLTLGDRLEVGRAVLVVGRTVSRPRGVDDVLAHPRRSQPQRRTTRRSRWPLFASGAAVVSAAAMLFLFTGGDSASVRSELAQLSRWQKEGRVEMLAERIARLRGEWAAAADDRLQRLDQQAAALAKLTAAVDGLRAAVLDPADGRDYHDWLRALQQQEASADPVAAVAARVVRGQLRDTIEQRPKGPRLLTLAAADAAASSAPEKSPQPAPSAPAPTPDLPPAPSAATPPWPTTTQPAIQVALPPSTGITLAPIDAPAAAPAAPAGDDPEVERLVVQGQFASALGLLQVELGQATDAAAVAAIQARAQSIRAAARSAADTVLAQADGELRSGRPAAAAALLQAAAPRFPADGEFAPLLAALASAEQQAATAAAAVTTTPATKPDDGGASLLNLASLRSQMDAVRDAEDRSDFAAAATGLQAVAAAVRERDAGFADRLLVRALEAELLAAWQDVATAAAGKVPVWHEIGKPGIEALVAQCKPTGRPALGAAALLYRHGHADAAEALLAQRVVAEPAHRELIDRVVARGRGEPWDPRGYQLQKGVFVSARSIAAAKAAKAVAGRIESVLAAADPAGRDKMVADVLAGSDGAAALQIALRAEFDQQVAKLTSGPLRKQFDRMLAQRQKLDELRQTAKELIYDQVRYFYPYRPPAVASDRYAEYVRVQADVDRRVAAVRALWDDTQVVVRVSAGLQRDLDRLDWTAGWLQRLGAIEPSALAAVEWARALPPGETVGLRDFCRTPAERAEFAAWRRVEAYNRAVEKDFSAPQRELLQVTNEYRVMFGHRPLAIVRTACDASQGHADEMGRLGYFSHTSPTPGRRTPIDRLKLAGYAHGGSENIALNDSAPGAHGAWCTSSGHHRNLLDAGHTEIGIGCAGRNWVQNFGRGKEHRAHPDYQATPAKR